MHTKNTARPLLRGLLLVLACGCSDLAAPGSLDGGRRLDGASVDASDSVDAATATDGPTGTDAGDAGTPPPVCPPAVSEPPPTTIGEGIVPPLPWDLAPVTGTDHVVASVDELLAALTIVGPGDAISIEGGTYDDWGQLVLAASVSGTAEAPIVIRSRGAPVIFTGDTQLTIRGHHVHLYGLSFRGVAAAALRVDGSAAAPATGVRFSMIHCREVVGRCLYIEDAARVRFDHSLVERSRSKGVHVGNASTLTRIDHNVFRDREVPVENNGFEQIQLGHTTFTGNDDGVDSIRVTRTDALIDHNVFSRCEGEGELIGIKTSGNKIVFNVIVDAHERGNVSFRSGPNNLMFGNVLRDTRGGTRLMGKANRVVHNLIVDPIQYAGVEMPWGSDTAYIPDGETYYTVEYVASRGGLVRNNTIALTPHIASSARALAEDRQSEGECQRGSSPDDLDCTVVPFDNVLTRNLVINDREGSSVNLSPDLVATNTFADNLAALSASATLASTTAGSSALAAVFPPAPADLAATHRALAEHVWEPEAGVCLRLDSPDQLDAAIGVLFVPGACERACEDPGRAWLDVELFETEALDSFVAEAMLMEIITTMPPSALPPIPARP